MTKLPYLKQMKHRSKRYKVYVAEAPAHYQSIMNKYGMPPIAHAPIEDDILEKVMNEQRLDWKPKGSWSIRRG